MCTDELMSYDLGKSSIKVWKSKFSCELLSHDCGHWEHTHSQTCQETLNGLHTLQHIFIFFASISMFQENVNKLLMPKFLPEPSSGYGWR